jgi:hypothetical protein
VVMVEQRFDGVLFQSFYSKQECFPPWCAGLAPAFRFNYAQEGRVLSLSPPEDTL